jgi:uncharacterized damage-inducible protein DinB/predicted RNase H-like HicB family nuclease
MPSYALYLESGPRRRKTMVHVLDLLGCIAVGPTTDAALAATPDAIRTYAQYLRRHGEPAELSEPIETHVAEHVTEGSWLGNGSPYLIFGPDLEPLTEQEIERFVQRLAWICDDLAAWAASQNDGQLDATPADGGRPAHAVLLHVLGAQGTFLAAALGGAPGFAALHGAAGRDEIALPDALRRAATLTAERVRAATPEQRAAVRELPAGPRTLRKALRRMLEHDWEHLTELARRPGGPDL